MELRCGFAQSVVTPEHLLKRFGVDDRYGHAVITKPGANDTTRFWVGDDGDYYSTDDWDVTYRMNRDPGYYYDIVEFPMEGTEAEDDDKIHWPDYAEIDPEATLKLNKGIIESGYFNSFCHAYNLGVYESGPHLYGYDDWLAMLIEEPERVDRYLTKLVDRKLEWYGRALGACGDYVDLVAELDDLGTQTSTWMSVDMYKKLVFPHHKRLFQGIKKLAPKAKVFLHSCGAVAPLLPYYIEAGADVFNPVQTSAAGMDPYKLNKEFGSELTFWGGGIDTQRVLPFGTKQEIFDDVHRHIDALAPGGGYVFSPIHNTQPDVPPQNFMYMLEAFNKYCNY